MLWERRTAPDRKGPVRVSVRRNKQETREFSKEGLKPLKAAGLHFNKPKQLSKSLTGLYRSFHELQATRLDFDVRVCFWPHGCRTWQVQTDT
jgi:hypothetical protein